MTTTKHNSSGDAGAPRSRVSASRHASVWLSDQLLEDSAIRAVGSTAVIWWRLPFLADDDGALPTLDVIAADLGLSADKTQQIITSFLQHGLVERDDEARLRMSAHSQTLYCYSEEEADAREAVETAQHTTEDEA